MWLQLTNRPSPIIFQNLPYFLATVVLNIDWSPGVGISHMAHISHYALNAV